MKTRTLKKDVIACDPLDMAVTMNYMEQAANEKDPATLEDFYFKLMEQVDAFYEECEEQAKRLGNEPLPGWGNLTSAADSARVR